MVNNKLEYLYDTEYLELNSFQKINYLNKLKLIIDKELTKQQSNIILLCDACTKKKTCLTFCNSEYDNNSGCIKEGITRSCIMYKIKQPRE